VEGNGFDHDHSQHDPSLERSKCEVFAAEEGDANENGRGEDSAQDLNDNQASGIDPSHGLRMELRIYRSFFALRE
jgi:hypothetical protein